MTGNISIDEYKNNQYLNGDLFLNIKETPNKVSNIIIIKIKIVYN